MTQEDNIILMILDRVNLRDKQSYKEPLCYSSFDSFICIGVKLKQNWTNVKDIIGNNIPCKISGVIFVLVKIDKLMEIIAQLCK